MGFINVEYELLLFDSGGEFPLEGLPDKLYVDKGNFNKAYFWDAINEDYVYYKALDLDTITSADAASETNSGTIQIATQAETDAGLNNTKAITPLKLANFAGLGGLIDLLDGSGLIGGGVPNGVWATVNLGVGLENKIVFIQIVSSVNPQRQVGARSVGGGTEICNLQSRNSISFLVKADSNADIQLFKSGGGISFVHRKTLVN